MPAAPEQTRERVPTIHIGLPKTATKTLQWRIFSRHSEIFYLGRFDGPQFRKQFREFDACRDAEVQALMREIAYDNISDPDLARCQQLLASILEPAKARGLVPVWSWESYSTDVLAKQRQRANNLRNVFGDANILVTIRHPVDLLQSAFLQQLKRDNVGPRASRKRGVFYCSFNQWVAAEMDREVAIHLGYAETIKIYLQLFGRERVHVMVFEDLRRDSDAFFARVCDSIGVDPDEGVRLAASESDNSRWTQLQLDALRAIQRSWWRSWRFRLAGRKERRAMLGLQADGSPAERGPRAEMPLEKHLRDRVFDMTREGNHWLCDVFKLSLGEHGYLES
jgi:hypothetical protein